MICSRTKIWIALGALGVGVFFRAELLRAQASPSEFTAESLLAPATDPVPGTVGTFAGINLFAPGTDHATHLRAFPVAGLIEEHLRAERDLQARELAFQELDAIQLSAEFEFEQTDRLLTVTPVEERRSSGLLLATSPHSARMGAGSAARAVPTSRDTHWTPAGHTPLTDRRIEHGSAQTSARPVPLAAHTDYFSIRNGYIRKGRAQNVPPAVDSAPVLFSIFTFSISHDSVPDHFSRFSLISKPTATPACAEKSAREWFGAAPGQMYDQVPA